MLLGTCHLTTEEKHVLEMKTWTQELQRTDLYSAQGRASLTHTAVQQERRLQSTSSINSCYCKTQFYSPRHHTTACLFTPLPVK